MQFTTSQKQHLTVKQSEKIISHLQIEADNITFRCMKSERMLLISHFIDFHPCIFKYITPIFVSESAIDFLIANHNEIKKRFSISNIIEYGKMYRNTVEIIKMNPANLTQLKHYYLSINPA